MATLILPEIFEVLSRSLGEIKLFVSNHLVLKCRKLFELFLVESTLGNGNVTLIFVSTGVHDLNLVEFARHHLFKVLPVYLVVSVFSFVALIGLEVNDFWLFEVGDLENDTSKFISLDFLIFWLLDLFLFLFASLFLLHSLSISLLDQSRELLVIGSTHHLTVFLQFD